jgi:hypothetical protein
LSAAIQGLRLVLLLIAVCFASPGMAGNKVNTNDATSVQAVTEVAFRSRIHGPCTLTYNSSAIRMDCTSRGVVFLIKAPDWRMYYFKPSSKVYFDCPGKDFIPDDVKTFHSMRPGSPGALKPISYRKTILMGRPCTFCVMENPQKVIGAKLPRWQKLLIKSGELWIDEVPGIPIDAFHTIQRSLGLPYTKGLPLKMNTVNNDGFNVSEPELKLYSINYKKVPRDFFTLPKGFSRAKNATAVGENQDPEIYEIMR